MTKEGIQLEQIENLAQRKAELYAVKLFTFILVVRS